MIRDHRPYYIKKLDLKFRNWYVEHFLRPQFKYLGSGYTFMKPQHVEIFGWPIELGDYANIVATRDDKVWMTIWSEREDMGRIKIGDYCLLCPGVRIGSANEVIIGNSCMMARRSYITDSDWHGIYNRVIPGNSAPVRIGNNVWIGDSAIVCKGVTIGDNSIIGAGSVVVHDIPPNCIAAGNPAAVVKNLDPEEPIRTRAHWFSLKDLEKSHDQMDKNNLKNNNLFGWIRSLLFPAAGD